MWCATDGTLLRRRRCIACGVKLLPVLGRENVRQKIYDITSRIAPQLLADVPRIGYGDWQPSPSASEKPYGCRCNMCSRKFGQMSSLLNHQADFNGHAASRPSAISARLCLSVTINKCCVKIPGTRPQSMAIQTTRAAPPSHTAFLHTPAPPERAPAAAVVAIATARLAGRRPHCSGRSPCEARSAVPAVGRGHASRTPGQLRHLATHSWQTRS